MNRIFAAKPAWLVLLCVLMLSVVVAGCESASDRLANQVRAFEKNLPIDLGMMGELSTITYDKADNELEMVMNLNGVALPLDVLRDNSAIAAEGMKLGFIQGDARKITELMAEAGASLTVKYVQGSDSYDLTITNAELNDLIKGDASEERNAAALLASNIAMANAQYPQTIQPGMVMTRMYDTGSDVVYECMVDESLYDLGMIRPMVAQLKQEMAGAFDDPAVKMMFELVVSQGRNLIYRYKGSESGDSVDVAFSPDELKAHI